MESEKTPTKVEEAITEAPQGEGVLARSRVILSRAIKPPYVYLVAIVAIVCGISIVAIGVFFASDRSMSSSLLGSNNRYISTTVEPITTDLVSPTRPTTELLTTDFGEPYIHMDGPNQLSCVGFCGRHFFNCSCDVMCLIIEDCCDDFQEHCIEKSFDFEEGEIVENGFTVDGQSSYRWEIGTQLNSYTNSYYEDFYFGNYLDYYLEDVQNVVEGQTENMTTVVAGTTAGTTVKEATGAKTEAETTTDTTTETTANTTAETTADTTAETTADTTAETTAETTTDRPITTETTLITTEAKTTGKPQKPERFVKAVTPEDYANVGFALNLISPTITPEDSSCSQLSFFYNKFEGTGTLKIYIIESNENSGDVDFPVLQARTSYKLWRYGSVITRGMESYKVVFQVIPESDGYVEFYVDNIYFTKCEEGPNKGSPKMTLSEQWINALPIWQFFPDVAVPVFQDCGTVGTSQFRHARMLGGEYAIAGKWPWSVALLDDSRSDLEFICGGSLITESWIITAAHCVYVDLGIYGEPRLKSNVDFHLVLGDTHYQGLGSPFKKEIRGSKIERIVPHPEYKHIGDESFTGDEGLPYDFALIKIKEESYDSAIKFSSYIKPICVSDLEIVDDYQSCYAVGWGPPTGEQTFEYLQEARMPFISQDKCKKWQNFTGSAGRIGEEKICAGRRDAASAACGGDSGGPLMCKVGGRWHLVGVTSINFGTCGTPGYVTVYSKIAHVIDWIQSTIASVP